MSAVAAGPPWAGASRWHYRRSLASRVILLTTIAVGLAVAMVSVGAYATVRMQLEHSLDDTLVHRAKVASLSLGVIHDMTDFYGFSPVVLGAADVRIGLVDVAGKSVFFDQSDDVLTLGAHEYAVASGRVAQSIRTIRSNGTNYRVVAVPSYTAGVALVIAQSLESQEHLLDRLGLVTLFFGLAGMIAAGLAGWGVASNGLRPVRRLTSAVEGIARTEDLTPLPVEGDDEVARLATAFNQMLLSLAASRDRQRRLVADAGHELRTPLTSLRTNIDLLTQVSSPGADAIAPQARDELLADVRAQLEELSQLVGDLVELARDEPLTGENRAYVFGNVELTELLDQAVARVRRRAPGLRFEATTQPWFVDGEPVAIERALTNLLDNAAKWSPPGGTVRVSLAHGEVTVDDEGPGIPDADLPHVFERFYRSTESRSMPGSGLGLSIAAQVAERHAGTVTAGRSPSGGARLVLRLPGAARPKPTAPPVGVGAVTGSATSPS